MACKALTWVLRIWSGGDIWGWGEGDRGCASRWTRQYMLSAGWEIPGDSVWLEGLECGGERWEGWKGARSR